MSEARLGRILSSRGIRGIITLPQLDPDEKSRGYELFPWEKFASVSIGFSCLIPDTHRVMHDQIQALHIAMSALRKLGYQRPSLIIKRWVDNRLRNHWSAGFLSCQLRYYPKQDHVPPFMDTSNPARLVSWFRRWKPDALIGPDLAESIGYLKEAGIRSPRDFGYATLDKQTEGKWAFHSGIAQRSTYVGETAVNLLVGCLLRNEIGLPSHPQVVLLPGVWMDGKTSPQR
jgi:LacI family transcriptional regulator